MQIEVNKGVNMSEKKKKQEKPHILTQENLKKKEISQKRNSYIPV